MRTRTVVALGLGAVLGGLAGYELSWRGACLNWGATAEEAGGEVAGDLFLPRAPLVSTRAVTVAAPPGKIWPWLVQMGPGRGGAYTYDWIENLFGLDMHSADAVLPQFQDLREGDVLPMGASGPRMRVGILDAERALVLCSEDGAWVWAFALRPQGAVTRLVSRNRIVPPSSWGARAFYRYVMEPGSLVMERKMLLGIKRRAESLG
ncbi:hypothetical protein AB0C76_39570 [Kitasatospora sp. NPDC048722]|uniref:hypothetical protein n=1 Tax=Kitasatospora sp. NPDC048722 TaxID=3155639 RepID=UPI0033EA0DD6